MSRWFRFYDEALDDDKVQLLPDDLFRAWVNLLCLASKNDGALPALKSVSFRLRKSEDEVSEILNKLYRLELLDEIEVPDAPMSYSPHNWGKRQYKSDVSTERVKRFRNGSKPVTVTPPETEQITETDQKDCADAPPDPSIAEREYFTRGREVLGPKAGSLLGKLLNFKGKNVALARAVIEEASQKSNAHEWVGAHLRGPPAVRVTTAFQQSRAETKDILNDLDDYANGRSSGSETDFGILPGHSGERQQGIRGGPRPTLIDISPRSRQTSG